MTTNSLARHLEDGELNDGIGGRIHAAKKNIRKAAGDVTGAYSNRNDGARIGIERRAVARSIGGRVWRRKGRGGKAIDR